MVDFTSQKNIGMTRFELATPATRTRCATKLRYIPINYKIVFFSEKRSLVYLLNGSREPEALLSPAPLSTCHRHLANGRPCYIPINYKIVFFSEKRSLVYLLNGSREPEALLSPAPLSTCHRHLANGRPCYIPIYK